MKHFVSWILIKKPTDLLNGNIIQKKSSSPMLLKSYYNKIFKSKEQIPFFLKLKNNKKIVKSNNYTLGDITILNKHHRNFSNDFIIMPPLNMENKNNNNTIKTMRTNRIFQSSKKENNNHNHKIKINKRNSFNDLLSLKNLKKQMVEKLIFKKGENDSNGNNLYEDDKDDSKIQKIYIENNCTILKESLTKPYVKNKKNKIKENNINEDNNYGKKIQNINFRKVKIPLIYSKKKIIERIKKEKYKNFVNINNKSMKNMKNNTLNIFYNDIQNLAKEINQINNKIFNVYVEGKNIFNS